MKTGHSEETAIRDFCANCTAAPRWPPLSSAPGQLVPRLSYWFVGAMHARDEKAQTAFISPAHPDAERMRKAALANLWLSWTDDSYWYTGYAIHDEEAGLAFVNAYKDAIEHTGSPPSAAIMLDSPVEIALYQRHAPDAADSASRPQTVKLSTVSPLAGPLGTAKVLPFAPLSAGFAADTLFYGGAWLALLIVGAVPMWLRTTARRRRGECEQCGYDLRGHSGGGGEGMCPECGVATR